MRCWLLIISIKGSSVSNSACTTAGDRARSSNTLSCNRECSPVKYARCCLISGILATKRAASSAGGIVKTGSGAERLVIFNVSCAASNSSCFFARVALASSTACRLLVIGFAAICSSNSFFALSRRAFSSSITRFSLSVIIAEIFSVSLSNTLKRASACLSSSSAISRLW